MFQLMEIEKHKEALKLLTLPCVIKTERKIEQGSGQTAPGVLVPVRLCP